MPISTLFSEFVFCPFLGITIVLWHDYGSIQVILLQSHCLKVLLQHSCSAIPTRIDLLKVQYCRCMVNWKLPYSSAYWGTVHLVHLQFSIALLLVLLGIKYAVTILPNMVERLQCTIVLLGVLNLWGPNGMCELNGRCQVFFFFFFFYKERKEHA